ncbi:group III truncated hemoglobin [Sneathiella marina]|uniref:Group III truncated hemoglobin n=1 Tax=Sneathiella marina TaxID=2950108 RepID=A0ABY4VZ67_9PROT|nr:group III truncated hemoglobin [Sneathiella marina]USG60165.1 group III truncated hemoglobin [Sneathiella marina]
MTFVVRSAEERRREIQEAAARMGIDDAYISELVETFYEAVRADNRLGPIFAAKIGGNWTPHLAKMKDFWSSVAMNSGRYNGKPVVVHNKLSTVTQEHFQIWLALFRQTLEATAPTPEVIPYFMERAERIAESLQLSMFGYPGIKKQAG